MDRVFPMKSIKPVSRDTHTESCDKMRVFPLTSVMPFRLRDLFLRHDSIQRCLRND